MICPSPTVIKRPQATIESVKSIPDLKIIHPKAFPDERGFFCESYNCDDWAKTLNFHEVFKQVDLKRLFRDFTNLGQPLLFEIWSRSRTSFTAGNGKIGLCG
jgi:hypothetical protein